MNDSKAYYTLLSIINSNNIIRKNKYDKIRMLCNSCKNDSDKVFLCILQEVYGIHTHFALIDKPFEYVINIINEDATTFLIKLLDDIDDIFSIAIINDLLWLKKHDFSYAQKAVDNYVELIKNKEISLSEMSEYICRIVDISIKTKKDTIDFFQIEDICINKIENEDSENFVPKFILEALSLHNKCDLNKIDKCCRIIVKGFKDKGNYYNERGYAEFLTEIYKKQKKDIKQLQISIAKSFEDEANTYDVNNPECSIQVISLLLQAMECWNNKNLPNYIEERKRLAKKLEPIQELSLKSFKQFNHNLDVANIYKSITDYIVSCNFYQGLKYLIKGLGLRSKNQLYEHAKKATSVFEQIFSTNLVDNKGKLIAIIPSFNSIDPNDKEKNVIYKTKQLYDLYAQVILYIIKELNKKFTYTTKNLSFLVDNNVFIPKGRNESFLMGLTAGFNSDYLTAMHILMPQVENAIRQLCADCGIVVYKTFSNGVQEVISLDTLLSKDEVIDIFDDDTLFNYKLFFCSEYGYCMRNKIAHGLIDDIYINQGNDAVLVWWFILRICCQYKLAEILEKEGD